MQRLLFEGHLLILYTEDEELVTKAHWDNPITTIKFMWATKWGAIKTHAVTYSNEAI